MTLEATGLAEEVNAIQQWGEGSGNHRLQVVIRAGEWVIDPLKIDLLSRERNYENFYGEQGVLQVLLGAGIYAHQLYPHRDELYVEITYIVLREALGSDRSDTPRTTRRYRAILMQAQDPTLTNPSPEARSLEASEQLPPVPVQFQLVEERAYLSRLYSVGQVFRNTTAMDVLKASLTQVGQALGLSGEEGVAGVDVVPGYNPVKRRQIVIPHGTPLIQLADFLQQHEGGLYGAGVGCYLQHQHWYVFPLYDPTQVRTNPRVLTVFDVPTNRYLGAERTYRTTDQQVLILAAGGMGGSDTGLANQLNVGTGVRLTAAEQLLSFGHTKGNRTIVERQRNIHEFNTLPLEDGLVHAPWALERASSNVLKHHVGLAYGQGQETTFQWYYGNADLLYPGMPVRYYVQLGDRLLEYQGTLLGVLEQRVPREAGMEQASFPASVSLRVFLQRIDAD